MTRNRHPQPADPPPPLHTPKPHPQVLSTLIKIRRHDPDVFQPEVRFFNDDDDDDEEGDDEAGGGKGKKEKPIYLRSLLAQQALEGGADAGGSSGDEEEEGGGARPKPGSYAAEQIALKEALKSALGDAEGSDDEEGGGGGAAAEAGDAFAGGVLKAKPRRGGADEPGGEPGDKAAKVNVLLDEYFGPEDEKLSEADRFLKRYLATQAWRGEGGEDLLGAGGGSDGEGEGAEEGVAADFEHEEEFLEQADRFEAAYNFRWGPTGWWGCCGKGVLYYCCVPGSMCCKQPPHTPLALRP